MHIKLSAVQRRTAVFYGALLLFSAIPPFFFTSYYAASRWAELGMATISTFAIAGGILWARYSIVTLWRFLRPAFSREAMKKRMKNRVFLLEMAALLLFAGADIWIEGLANFFLHAVSTIMLVIMMVLAASFFVLFLQFFKYGFSKKTLELVKKQMLLTISLTSAFVFVAFFAMAAPITIMY